MKNTANTVFEKRLHAFSPINKGFSVKYRLKGIGDNRSFV